MPGSEFEAQIVNKQKLPTSGIPRTKTPDRLTLLKTHGLRPNGLPRRDATKTPPITFSKALKPDKINEGKAR